MKTEQEQTKQMLKTLCDKFQCSAIDRSYMAKSCRQCEDIIEALHEAGYGDVSEYKAEIERLKEEMSNIRKETAREILDMLYDMGIDKETLECCRIFDVNGVSLTKQICEKYGVEIEK